MINSVFFSLIIPILSSIGMTNNVKESQLAIDKCIVNYFNVVEVKSAQIIIYKEEAYVIISRKSIKHKLPPDLSKQLFYYAERICSRKVKIIKKKKRGVYL